MRHYKVSIQGEVGSYHHETALNLFPEAEFFYRDRFPEVFEDGKNGRSDFLLVAIENSLAGSLAFNYDLLEDYRIPIIGETYMKIRHQLIGYPGTKLSDVREIWSHPMAIAQCSKFLGDLNVNVVEKADTAGSVRLIREMGRKDIAAIAGKTAAKIYEMDILSENIETDHENYTRFLILSDKYSLPVKEGAPIKTSLYCRLNDEPGSLMRLLQPLTEAKVNMTKIESRPRVGKPWKYDFYVDLLMDANSEAGINLMEELKKRTRMIVVLGSYPVWDKAYEVEG